jgi:pseudouridine synthase
MRRESRGTVKLARFVSLAGRGSRRKAEEMILEGRVELNGIVVREVGTRIDPREDRVTVDGISAKLPAHFTYMMLHKPPGYVCSTKSRGSQRPIYSLLPGQWTGRLKYAGRLDADSEGLVLLTDDGELIYRLTHPRFKQAKIYLVFVDRSPDRRVLERLRKGVVLEDGPTLPARVSLARKGGEALLLQFELTEGRKRQVRRMCDAVGLKVRRLTRTGMGPLRLGGLGPGRARMLTQEEVRSLLHSVALLPTSP